MATALKTLPIAPSVRTKEFPAIDPSPFLAHNADGTASLILLVDGIHCGNCVQRIERALGATAGIVAARVNMTTKRLSVSWQENRTSAEDIVATLADLGYPAVPFNVEPSRADGEERGLLRALAVAGFAATNVMLLSVAVWAGAFGDMGPATRNLLQWVSALIEIGRAHV